MAGAVAGQLDEKIDAVDPTEPPVGEGGGAEGEGVGSGSRAGFKKSDGNLRSVSVHLSSLFLFLRFANLLPDLYCK